MLHELPARTRSSMAVRDHPRSDYTTFLDDLREIICLRLDQVNPYRESKEYCLQQEKASRLYEKLRELLPEEGQAMLLQYSEALGAAHCLETTLMAEHAFLDGMSIALIPAGRLSHS